MAATSADIRRWLLKARDEGATHVVIVCDTYDWTDYPVEVPFDPDGYFDVGPLADRCDPGQVAEALRGRNMRKVMEVYSLTGKHSIEDQLAEFRAFHYD